MRLENILSDAYHVLSLIILQQVQMLQGGNNVLFTNTRHLADFIDRDAGRRPLLTFQLQQNLQYRLTPITPVRQQPQIRKRFLRVACFPLKLTKFVTEFDEQVPITFPLIRGKCEDTSDVVIFTGFLLLRKVPDNVEAVCIELRHDVEEKGIRIVV